MADIETSYERLVAHHVPELDPVLDALGLSWPECEVNDVAFATSAAHLLSFMVDADEDAEAEMASNLYYMLKRAEGRCGDERLAASYALGVVIGEADLRENTSYPPEESRDMIERSLDALLLRRAMGGIDGRRALHTGYMLATRHVEDTHSSRVRKKVRDFEKLVRQGGRLDTPRHTEGRKRRKRGVVYGAIATTVLGAVLHVSPAALPPVESVAGYNHTLDDEDDE